MKNRDEILDRLFRAAVAPVPPKELPFVRFRHSRSCAGPCVFAQRIGHHRAFRSARCHDRAGSHRTGISGSLSRLNF